MRRRRIGRWAGSAAQTVMAALCVFNFVMTPYFECQLDGDICDERLTMMAGIFARSVSITCLVTVAVGWYKYHGAVAAYHDRVELNDAYAAPAGAPGPRYVSHSTFAGFVLCVNAMLIVPVNALRLYRFFVDGRPGGVIMYFVLMYTQNLYVCVFETRFMQLFYSLYTRFADLNREMEVIGERIEDGRGGWIRNDGDDERRRHHRPHCSLATGGPLVDAVGRLRIRHRLLREAVDALKPTFALPVGLSLCNLCVMFLFDVYYHLKNSVYQPAGNLARVFILLWLTQYTFRFFVITMTVDVTMKQASRSKETITDISRCCLDISTKEELQIFSNQISSTAIQFTMCDLFTINARLFTSAVGVCITYLVILLQFKVKVDNVY